MLSMPPPKKGSPFQKEVAILAGATGNATQSDSKPPPKKGNPFQEEVAYQLAQLIMQLNLIRNLLQRK